MKKAKVLGALDKIIKGEFAKKSFFSFALKALGLLFSYLFSVLISRYYGAEIVGRFSLAFTILNIFALIFALGIPDAIVKIASDTNYNSRYDFKKTGLKIIFFSGVTGSLLLFLLAEQFSYIFKDHNLKDYFIFSAFILLPLIVLRFNYEFLRGNNKIVKYGLLSHVIPYFIAILCFIFVFDGNYFYNIGVQTIVTYAVGVLIAFCISLFWVFKGDHVKRELFHNKKLLEYSIPMLITSSFIFLMGWSDTLMLGYFNSKAEVGIYSIVLKIAKIAVIIITSVNLVLAPRISQLHSMNQNKKMNKLVVKSTRVIFILTTPLVILTLLFNKTILSLFGEEFVIGSSALIIIMLSMLFNAFCGSVGQVMNMTGHHRKLRNYTIVSAVLNISLNLILIPKYGIIGAAIATGISTVFLNVISVIFVKRKLNLITYFTFR